MQVINYRIITSHYDSLPLQNGLIIHISMSAAQLRLFSMLFVRRAHIIRVKDADHSASAHNNDDGALMETFLVSCEG